MDIKPGDIVRLPLRPRSGGSWVPEYRKWALEKRTFVVIGERDAEKVWILEGKSAFKSDLELLGRRATLIL